MLCIKRFESWHGREHYPYVGYGHQLQPGEPYTFNLMEREADALLRSDLSKLLWQFRHYGKDALLLAVLACNVGHGRLLGSRSLSIPKSTLVRKIEKGDRAVYWDLSPIAITRVNDYENC